MIKPISREELKKKLDQDEDFTLIEVLDEEEYERKHIRGAVNMPLKKIGSEAEQELNHDDDIVVYCANKDCDASPKAAEKLEKLGFTNVKDYEEGKSDWEKAGYPMESGDSS